MKAWRFYSVGNMQLDEVPDPAAKPGWVVCKIRRFQPSITDALRAYGIETMGIAEIKKIIEEQAPVQLLGHEMSAEVIEVGEGVKEYKVGDIVSTTGHASCGSCLWCYSGYDSWCKTKLHVGITIPGAFAEKVALPETCLIKVPSSMDDASIVCLQPLSTTVAAIRDADLKPGQTVAVTGQGVMGLYMLQAVRMSGARAVYVTDVRDASLSYSKKFSADAMINAANEDPVDRIMELTHGKGVDVVFECAGGHPQQGLAGHTTLHHAFRMVGFGGAVVQVAALTGEVHIDPDLLRVRGIRWIFTKGHGKETMSIGAKWVEDGRIDVKSLILHELNGIEKLPEALDITCNKDKYGAVNPCQIVLTDE